MTTTLTQAGAMRQGRFVTESCANDFPRLPVREGEPVLVGVAVFANAAEFERLQRSGRWASAEAPIVSKWLARRPEFHRLRPTARSALHAAIPTGAHR